jgi:hypothetical protein
VSCEFGAVRRLEPDGTSAEGGVVNTDGTSAEGGVVNTDGTSAEGGVVNTWRRARVRTETRNW